MSQPCAITNCKRASRTLCHCCNQNLCRNHFNEHDDLLNSQLNPLADEINIAIKNSRYKSIDKKRKEIADVRSSINDRRSFDSDWKIKRRSVPYSSLA